MDEIIPRLEDHLPELFEFVRTVALQIEAGSCGTGMNSSSASATSTRQIGWTSSRGLPLGGGPCLHTLMARPATTSPRR